MQSRVYMCTHYTALQHPSHLSVGLQYSCMKNKWISILEGLHRSSVVALLLLPDVCPTDVWP